MSANDTQVGGAHYKTSYEHWDWVLDIGMGYLEGCATKYVARWRNKGGAQDLKKALHYVNKTLEVFQATQIGERQIAAPLPQPLRPGVATIKRCVERFELANGLRPNESEFCRVMAFWNCDADLVKARDVVLYLLDQADPPTQAYTPSVTVPLEDSNKHAERVGFPHSEGGE